jgi:hypothetical protein
MYTYIQVEAARRQRGGTHIHIFVQVYMSTYICTYTYIHTSIHEYIHMYILTYVHTYIYTGRGEVAHERTYENVHIFICVYSHIFMYAHIYTYRSRRYWGSEVAHERHGESWPRGWTQPCSTRWLLALVWVVCLPDAWAYYHMYLLSYVLTIVCTYYHMYLLSYVLTIICTYYCMY